MWAIVPSGPTGGDRAAFGVLAATPGSPVVGAMKVLSHVAPPLLAAIVVLASAVVALRRQWPTAAALLGGTIITYGAVHLAKSIEQRPRPHGELMHAGGFAFPSTAAALSIALVAVAIVLERTPLAGGGRGRLLGPASVAVAALGALLMSVRVHYLTDVLAGWGLGVAVFAGAGLAAIAVSALPPRRRSRRPALPASRS